MADVTNQQLLDGLTDVIQQTEDRLSKRIDGVDKRIDSMDKRIDSIDERMAGMENLIDGLDERIGNMDKRMAGVEGRMAGLATKADLEQVRLRLERKIADSQKINVRQHLETRQSIGHLNREHMALREGLARAAEPVS